jgi:hypothetical protein
VLREVLQGLPDFRVTSQREPRQRRRQTDLIVDAVSKTARFRFFVEVKSRVTPQTALALCDQFPKLPARAIPVVYIAAGG